MSLSFSAPRFDEVKASIEECKEKDLTYCAPLFVTAEFTNNTRLARSRARRCSWVTSR